MPSLPTFNNLSQAQLDRVTAAFTNPTTNTPVQNYKAWLKSALTDAVFRYESQQINDKAAADVEAKRSDVDTSLGTMT